MQGPMLDRHADAAHALDAGVVTEAIHFDPHAELVPRMAAGDERAVGILYETYHASLFRVAQSIVRERADAEEVVNDTFARAWRDAARFDASRGSLARWLTTIVRSRALDLVRTRSRRERAHDRAEQSAAIDLTTVGLGWSTSWDAARHVETQELEMSLTRALHTLPAKQRQVIELAFLDEHSHSSVAELLDVPLGTVKTRARLGLSRMRETLAGSDVV